ncbi:MAG: DsrE family protein [Nitrospirae bacterium]|nr:DsrE family protein [Nitrospirota bacterium]
MAVLTIGIFSSLVGSMTPDFMFKLSEAALEKGHKVNIWVSGNAVSLIKNHQKHLKDYSTGEKPLAALIQKGVEVCTCEACTLARGIQKPDAVEGVQWNAMHWYLAKVHGSDRVLHMGGE